MHRSKTVGGSEEAHRRPRVSHGLAVLRSRRKATQGELHDPILERIGWGSGQAHSFSTAGGQGAQFESCRPNKLRGPSVWTRVQTGGPLRVAGCSSADGPQKSLSGWLRDHQGPGLPPPGAFCRHLDRRGPDRPRPLGWFRPTSPEEALHHRLVHHLLASAGVSEARTRVDATRHEATCTARRPAAQGISETLAQRRRKLARGPRGGGQCVHVPCAVLTGSLRPDEPPDVPWHDPGNGRPQASPCAWSAVPRSCAGSGAPATDLGHCVQRVESRGVPGRVLLARLPRACNAAEVERRVVAREAGAERHSGPGDIRAPGRRRLGRTALLGARGAGGSGVARQRCCAEAARGWAVPIGRTPVFAGQLLTGFRVVSQ